MKYAIKFLTLIIFSISVQFNTSFALSNEELKGDFQLKTGEELTLDLEKNILEPQFFHILFVYTGFDDELSKDMEKFKNLPNIMPFQKDVYKALSIGLIDMPSNKMYQYRKSLTKIEAIDYIFTYYGIATPKNKKPSQQFTDLPGNSKFAPIVSRAVELKLVTPKNSLEFGIADILSVKDALTMIINAEKIISNQHLPTHELIIAPSVSPSFPNGDVLNDVYQKILDFYYYDKTVDTEKLSISAIQGLVNGLNDRYSVFNSAEGTNQFVEGNSGEFEGVGMWIEKEGSQISVAGVVPDSPAEHENLKVGDIILKINGESVDGWTTQEVASKVKGKAGTQVVLFVQKRSTGRSEFVTLTRKKITINFVSGEVIRKNYAYFDISQFPQDLQKQFKKIADSIISPTTQGIILDFRNNPGGYISAAEDLLENFLDIGETMYYLDYRSNDKVAKSKKAAIYKGIPLVVLIDESTASASEIVAAALKDNKKATLIGEKSFGKGVAQQLFFYEDGSSLKLTIAEWLSPSKKRINHLGIVPDIQAKDDPASENDEAIDRAIQYFKNGN